VQVSQRLQEVLTQNGGRRSEEARSGSEGQSPRHSGNKRERDRDGGKGGAGEGHGMATSKSRLSFDVAVAEGKDAPPPFIYTVP